MTATKYDPKDYPGFPLGTFVYFGDSDPGIMAIVTDPEAIGIGCPTPGYRPEKPSLWVYWERSHRDMCNELDLIWERYDSYAYRESHFGLRAFRMPRSDHKGMWAWPENLRKVFPDPVVPPNDYFQPGLVPMEPKLTPQEINRRADASEGGIWPVTPEFVRFNDETGSAVLRG